MAQLASCAYMVYLKEAGSIPGQGAFLHKNFRHKARAKGYIYSSAARCLDASREPNKLNPPRVRFPGKNLLRGRPRHWCWQGYPSELHHIKSSAPYGRLQSL